MAVRRERGFVWIKRAENTSYRIDINGTDQTSSVVEASFTNAIIGEESNFKIRLDNNNEAFTGAYSGGEIVDFYLDFSGGPTKRFSGIVEKISREFGSKGNVLVLSGTNRYHERLLEVTITGEFTGATADTVLKSIAADFLPDLTTTNVNSTTSTIDNKWEDVAFYDFVIDLCDAVGFDCYVDPDGDIHFFKRNSVVNETEAIVQTDNLIAVEGLADDLVDIKNSIKVQSEDDEGLPLLWTSEANGLTTSTTNEKIIKNSSLTTEDQLKSIAAFNRKDTAETKGSATSFFLPSLQPGDYLWIVQPSQNIHGQYRIVKFTHKIPAQTTTCVVQASKDTSLYLRDRKRSEERLENLKNPYKMKWSYNFTFDDSTRIDSASSSNVEVSDGALKTISGTAGLMVSVSKDDYPSDVTQFQVQVKGEELSGASYRVSADGGDNWTTATKDALGTFNISGNNLKIEITLSSSTTRIASFALLVK